jgi:hypothetical protein
LAPVEIPGVSVASTVEVARSVKVTEPVGSPLPVQVTTAVKVTVWLGDTTVADGVTATVVVVVVTVVVPCEERHSASPEYTLVTVCAVGGEEKVAVTGAAVVSDVPAPVLTSGAVPKKTGVAVVVSKKLTVPVGSPIPPVGHETTAVKATVLPDGVVLGAAVTVVVVGSVGCAWAGFMAGATRATIPVSTAATIPTRRANN